MTFNLDKILNRASNLSQVGLLGVAVFTIWYTVIPLYGKAVLEEQVAEKQIELKNLNEKIEKQYSTLRSEYLYQLRVQFVSLCFITSEKYLNADREGRIYYNPTECIHNITKNTLSKSMLEEHDKEKILEKVNQITSQINIKNKEYIDDYRAIRNISIREINKLPSLTGLTKIEYEAHKKYYLEQNMQFPEDEEFKARKVQYERDLISLKTKTLGDIILKTLN
ncbi:hypothetical protein [Acinetobacter sp. ANC 5502]